MSKYGSPLEGVQNVVPVRECMIDIIKLVLRKSFANSALDLYKAAIVQYFENLGFTMVGHEPQISAKTVEIMASCIYARRDEL